jgi:hypothetical protein
LSIPVILPEAVSLHEEAIVNVESPAQLVVVVVESSDFLQAPMTAIMPTIMVSQKIIFFIITSLGLRKR